MDRVTASAETLMKQAGMTAAVYLDAAIEAIDSRSGHGYSEKHPELVGAFMHAAALDYAAAAITSALQDLAEAHENRARE